MNLGYTVTEIASITNAKIICPKQLDVNSFKIKNVVIDTRNPAINEQTLFIALQGLKSDGHQFLSQFLKNQGSVAVVSKEIDSENLCQLVVDDTLIALQQIATHHRKKFKIPTIAITGSNGKTTIKEWLYQVLKDHFNIVRSPKSYNSQIGVALSVLEITNHHNLAIFEAGISKPGEMEALEKIIQPSLGIFTGIGDAHSVNFNSPDEKKAEKFKLFSHVSLVFEPQENKLLDSLFTDTASLRNASVVFQVASHFQLNDEEILTRIKLLSSVAMRLQQVEGKNNCLLLNDSYNADLDSLLIALQQLDIIHTKLKKIVILTEFEESDQLQVRENLTNYLIQAKVDRLIFIGNNSPINQSSIPTEIYPSVDSFLHQEVYLEDATILIKGSRKYHLERIVHRLSEKKHITKLLINLSAMRNNLNFFKSSLNTETKILAMVKAQSYGGGLKEIAQFLVKEGVHYFGVAYADEGVILRQSGITTPIMVMNPESGSFDEITQYKLEPSIYSLELLEAFINHLILNEINAYPIHIKLDTGMNRLGFVESQIQDLINTLLTQPEAYIKSVFSHLSSADVEGEHEFTSNQIRKFEIMTGNMLYQLPYNFSKHIANSAGATNFKRSEYDMVRLGIGLYGLLGRKYPALENVLSFVTQISQIKLVQKGESVGYGRTYIATNDQLIGIIPVGYADGLRRNLSQGNWYVYIKGKKVPIIGNICMDMCMINLDGIDAKVGDDVEIFGNNVMIYDMAETLNTIPYEIISSISSRVHRVYLEE